MTRPGAMSRRLVALVALLVVVAAAARAYSASPLWLDEALSVNVARGGVGDVLDALRHEGHPPLYYLLLNAWMRVAGEGDTAVRLLSGLLSLGSLALAYRAAGRLGGRRAGLWAVALVGLSPFCVRYGTETRMYALLMFLVLVGLLLVRGALLDPTPARLAGITAVSALVAYTHYWSLYLLVVVSAAGAVAWKRGDRAAGRVTLAVAASAIAFVPWIPRFFDQLEHVGTPWGEPFRPTAAAAVTLVDLGGFGFGEVPLLGMIVVLLVAVACFARASEPTGSELVIDVARPQPAALEVGIAIATLLLGSVAAYVSDGTFASRYASAFVPLLLVAAAVGAARLPKAAAIVIGAAVAVLSAMGIGANVVDDRTQAADIAEAIAALAAPDDTVVYCPDQLGPAVARVLDQDDVPVDQVTYPDLGGPERIEWIDYAERLAAVVPEDVAAEIDRRAAGRDVFVVWSGGYRTHEETCERLVVALAARRGAAEVVEREDAERFERASLWRFGSRS